jgi:hypothetical protein
MIETSFFLLGVLLLQSPATSLVKQVASARLGLAQTMARDADVVAAVAAKNAEKETPEAIQKKDKDWTSHPDSPLRKALVGSPCAQRLRQLIAPDSMVIEAILMDNQGANVCVSRETTDYWQGDEPKWQRTFKTGQEVFVDEPAFDESAQSYAVQLSVPVAEGGQRTGALTLTLRVRKEDVPSAER